MRRSWSGEAVGKGFPRQKDQPGPGLEEQKGQVSELEQGVQRGEENECKQRIRRAGH